MELRTSGIDISSHFPGPTTKEKTSWVRRRKRRENINLLQETNILYCHWIQRKIYSKEGTYIWDIGKD